MPPINPNAPAPAATPPDRVFPVLDRNAPPTKMAFAAFRFLYTLAIGALRVAQVALLLLGFLVSLLVLPIAIFIFVSYKIAFGSYARVRRWLKDPRYNGAREFAAFAGLHAAVAVTSTVLIFVHRGPTHFRIRIVLFVVAAFGYVKTLRFLLQAAARMDDWRDPVVEFFASWLEIIVTAVFAVLEHRVTSYEAETKK